MGKRKPFRFLIEEWKHAYEVETELPKEIIISKSQAKKVEIYFNSELYEKLSLFMSEQRSDNSAISIYPKDISVLVNSLVSEWLEERNKWKFLRDIRNDKN